jgi:hypothetical protein
MEDLDKQSLDTRTRQRAALTWLTMDFGGVLAPLADIQTELNALALPSIGSYMDINDESWGIKEVQRDRTIELSQTEVDQDATIAAAKVTAGRLKIAIERGADEYALSAKIYDVSVRGLLMSARELAGLVEQEALAADAAKAAVDVDKEGVRQTQIAVKIQIEAIEAAQVDADIAKAQVDVAKAHVRAIMAEIEAGKAGVEVVETRVQVAMAEAEAATLQADVAMIFAEIVTHQLTRVRVGAEKAEIAAGYAIIDSKLADAIALYGAKALVEDLRAAAEDAVRGEIAIYQAARAAGEELRAAEAAVAVALANYEAAALAGEIGAEAGLREALVAARNALADARASQSIGRDTAQTAAQSIINAAHIGTYRLSRTETTSRTHETEYISG